MAIPADIEILTPWKALDRASTQEAGFHASELEKEICPGHILYGIRATAVALRVDCDDVLFEVEGAREPLAVVHLTWRKETDPRWPRTKWFESWEQWVRDEMIPAHEDYEL